MSELKLVKCVPNFCTCNKKARNRISRAITSVAECKILDVSEPNEDTKRTIYTFVGPPNRVVEAALKAAMEASECIDMSRHHGKHPRIGALDVCPFVPLWTDTAQESVKLAEDFGTRLAKELDVPVYFYEDCQPETYRKTLIQIRETQYEGLEDKLKDSRWVPDRGPAEFRPRWGATITGARKPLITFIVNLLASREHARHIADAIHNDQDPKKFKSVRAFGWYSDKLNMAQICTTITNFNEASMHHVFEECCRRAEELKLAIIGTIVHGLVPREAMLQAAKFYIDREKLFAHQEEQKIRLAIDRLHLSSVVQFKPEEKILEYIPGVIARDDHWLKCDVHHFVESVASWNPTPSAGGVAAHIAALGAALTTTVGLMTFGKERFKEVDKDVRAAIEPLYSSMKKLMPLTDCDAKAVEAYVQLRKQKQRTPFDEEKYAETLKQMCEVPLEVMTIASACWPHMKTIAEKGNIDMIISAEMGARSMDVAVQSAGSLVEWNVRKLAKKEHDYYTRTTRLVTNLRMDSTKAMEDILELVKSQKDVHMLLPDH